MTGLRNQLPAIIITSLVWIALFVAYVLYEQRQPQPQPIEIITPGTPAAETDLAREAAPVAGITPTPALLRVYVSGAVASPGVYRLPSDSLVVDAVEAAGGTTDNADLIAINLAHPLRDGEQIYVPALDENLPPPQPVSSSSAGGDAQDADEGVPSAPVDINTASQEELEQLPGIGPAMAKRIIEARPYNSVEDLMRVKGIGEARLEELRPYVVVK
jgi:competence protein ComEA